MALPNAKNLYLKTQVETASKEQLVVMLFDGIIRFTEQARKAIDEKQIEDSHHALMRAQAIIMELICTIDKEKGGEIATNLLGLHAYAFNCLIVCNMKKDVTQIDEVQKIYRELREAWVGAMDSLGISSNAGKPLPAAPAAPVASAPGKIPATGRTLGIASGFGRPTTATPAAKPATVAPTAKQTGNTGFTAPIRAITLPDSGQAKTPSSGYGMGRTTYSAAGMKQPAAQQILGNGGTRSIA